MKQKLAATILIAITLALPMPAGARFYDPSDILTDAELFDSNALSRTAIQRFLESKGSVLQSVTATVNGVPKLVSEMIYEIGKQYGISQKFLLTKLQQEQGLIDKKTATEKQLDWATGYSCFGGRCNDKYRGIYNQLDAAADTQRIYAERTYFDYAVGRATKTKDGYTVTPANQATANLYIYTPYQGSLVGIGGNFFFSRVWNQYFTERVYPDGTLLKDSATGEYWKIEQNKRRKFATNAIYLADYTPEQAITVSSQQISYYQASDPLTLTNNAVVTAEGSGIMYLLSNGLKQRLVGGSALASLGYHLADTTPVAPTVVSKAMLDALPEGEPITETSVYPKGILMKSDGSEIFYVKDGVRHQLLDDAVWQENFNRIQPTYVSQSTLSSFPPGDPVVLAEGSLVTSQDGTFYVISNGKKKRIASIDIATRMYGPSVVAMVPQASDATLNLTAIGDPIEYIDDTVQDPFNYVSYAERTGAGIQSQSSTPVVQPTYLTLYDTIGIPDSMIAGSTASVTVKFRNRGSATWALGKVFLKLIDENSSTSSFLANNRVPLSADAAPHSLAEFTFEIKAPLAGGRTKEWFIIEYTDASGNIVEMPGGLVGKDLSVVSGVSAQIIKHTIPVAVRNKWTPISITLEIKNTSTDQVWTSQRAAISLQAQDGTKSPFYDRNDWIDTDIVGVPVNKRTIKPGETGIVKFTLDPRRVSPGTYTLAFSMELRDAEKDVYLNGRQTWERMIRVDR
ncbi:hypothetical protein BK004_05070 [bacterium CG10_46_32]|nr:MAG: hypothetical protein BK004_05070 [bacterium CG10_46_32]PIR55639.1 MAG: hypothetical protein COU73_05120 [Parcubacteria group bacterium CG10_big_fil_rev_8_21_14_0_10_46_32]